MTPEPDDPLRADTIVAVATPPGSGAIGIVRVSGPAARAVVAPLIRLAGGRALDAILPRHVHAARVVDPESGADLDQALVTVMPGPRSYTGEDVVELSCHGSPAVLAAVVDRLVSGGARLAAPGEFTRRAYLNGRLDLVQAEAVALLIGARTERAARLAARQIGGALSTAIGAVREGVLDLLAGVEVSLDFPEDAVGLSTAAAVERCGLLRDELARLGGSVRQGRAIYAGLTVMLAGTPNVGKSSLLNALLGRERAIVSPEPGTTRDIVEGELVSEGVVVELRDGAGLGVARDAIDAEGMARACDAIRASDLVIVVLDRSRPLAASDERVLELTSDRERLLVANKCDLPPAWSPDAAMTACSALTGTGIAELRSQLDAWVKFRILADADEGGMVASLRVSEEVERARQRLEAAAAALERGLPIELALVDLREALQALDRILGLESDDAVLDRVFATFCVGK